MERPTVFVVDDDDGVREVIGDMLHTAGFHVQMFSTGRSLLANELPANEACLILDVVLPDMNGLELYRRLQKDSGQIPAIFLSGQADVQTVVQAMKLGAVEFLEKPVDHHVLLKKIFGALEKDRERRRCRTQFREIEKRLATLTPKEEETLAGVSAGLSNKELAAKLSISERAVEKRRANIMKKLRVRSLAELLNLTIRHGVAREGLHDRTV